MKKPILLFLSLLFPCLIFAQTEPANYKKVSMRFQKFYNEKAADSLYSCFGTAASKTITIEKTAVIIAQLQTAYGKLDQMQFISLNPNAAFYNADFAKGKFVMSLSVDNENKLNGFYFISQRTASKPIAAGLKEFPFDVNAISASLSGSLVIPEKINGKIPVVLIIAGSGPTDRNGNSSLGVSANSYYLLAEALGKAGIASLRYDKRGVGESKTTKAMVDIRFDDFVNDATALIAKLKADPRFSKIVVLGHSEGSLIGMIAAEKGKADGYISLAGAGDVISKILAVQLKSESPEAYKLSMARLDSLSKGIKVNAAFNDTLFSPILQPYMISWLKYNPQTEIKKLKIPVLILQGTTDLQVSVGDAQKIEKAKPNATLILLNGMNHALKQAPMDRQQNAASYKNPNLPIDAKLVKTVVQFVEELK